MITGLSRTIKRCLRSDISSSLFSKSESGVENSSLSISSKVLRGVTSAVFIGIGGIRLRVDFVNGLVGDRAVTGVADESGGSGGDGVGQGVGGGEHSEELAFIRAVEHLGGLRG